MQKLENKNRTVDIFHLSKQEMHGNRPFLFNSLGDILVLGVIFLVVFFLNTAVLRQKCWNGPLAQGDELWTLGRGVHPHGQGR